MTSRASASPSRRLALRSDLGASLVLTAFSLSVVAGFARVFSGWGFFDNLAVVALTGHALGLLLRRVRVPGWLAVPIVFVVLAWLIGLLHYRDTYSNLLPTTETVDLFRAELELVRDVFRVAVAPVEYGFGWDVLAAIGVGLTVLLSDAFAFRAGARAEALVPGGVLFVFVAAVGTDRLRIELTTLLVVVGALTVMVLRRYHMMLPPLRLVRRNRRAALIAPGGLVLAALIGLTAGFVGPRLPGADAEPLVDPGGGGRGGSTTFVSPLVDIRSRLVKQKNQELFVMEASEPRYWRTAALPDFDGTQWRIDAELEAVDGDLAEERDRSTRVEQVLRINALTGREIPAAADLIRIEGEDGDGERIVELGRVDELGMVVKSGDEGLSRGDQFVILSASPPNFDGEELAAATSVAPPSPVYLELPADLPPSVRTEAERVTAGATTPFDKARRLQDWFQDPDEFEYSLEVQEGHDNNALDAFLRERKGYCEQFAGTYAAMMRSLGIPARVAVGFTDGTETSPGVYSVLGKNAHAWSEVWFDGLGWVLFEPTPGRGAPGTGNYTGLSPAQDDSGIDEGAADEADEVTPPLTTVPGAGQQDAVPDLPFQESVDQSVPVDEPGGSGVSWWLLIVFGAAALVSAAPWIVRRLRRHAPASPDRELARLWQQVLATMSLVGVESRPTDTPTETAAMAAERFPTAARPLSELAQVVTEATYADGTSGDLALEGRYGSSQIRRGANCARQVEHAVIDSLGPAARVRRHFTTWS